MADTVSPAASGQSTAHQAVAAPVTTRTAVNRVAATMKRATIQAT